MDSDQIYTRIMTNFWSMKCVCIPRSKIHRTMNNKYQSMMWNKKISFKNVINIVCVLLLKTYNGLKEKATSKSWPGIIYRLECWKLFCDSHLATVVYTRIAQLPQSTNALYSKLNSIIMSYFRLKNSFNFRISLTYWR